MRTVLILVLLCPFTVMANEIETHIDGGVSLLVAMGVIFTIHKIYRLKKIEI